MDDLPYTTPDEDPFHVQPPVRLTCYNLQNQPSLLDQWINDQLSEADPDAHDDMLPPPAIHDDSDDAPRCGTPTHPFLAYPDIGRLPFEHPHESRQDDASSVYSYDLVNDDDLPEPPLTPQIPPTTPINKVSKTLLTSSTFRNLNLSFRAPNSIGSPTTNEGPSSPKTSPRKSLFTRPSRHSTSTTSSSKHTRSESLSTLNAMPTGQQSPTVRAASTSKWRPSVLGHFAQSPSKIPFDPNYTPPRPSLSSGDTYTSGNSASRTVTTLDSELPSTPTKPSFFESIRSKNRSSLSIFRPQHGHASSSSVWSHPCITRAPFDDHDPLEIPTIAGECSSLQGDGTLPRRMPFATKSVNQYDNLLDDEDDLDNYVPPPPFKHESNRTSGSFTPNSTFSRVGFGTLGSRYQKKKKLVISGVGVHETRKFEGVKRWCETFGEIRQISRVANGDLHIEFRKADVADTVCRVRAKVFISGVGSVYLSWTTGDKR